MRLRGKVALISGGASGMGAVEAKMFANEGAYVAIGDIQKSRGKDVESEINQGGGKCIFIHLDVTNEASWQKSVADTIGEFGRIDILVNNAGVSAVGLVEDTSVEDWDRVMDINAKGVFLGTKTVIPEMTKVGGGSIINISSQLGLVGMDNSSPQYQASKGAVRIFTKAAAIQYASAGIRVNSVHPGPVTTAMTAHRRSNKDDYAVMLSRIPLGRFADPIDIAYGVIYLASDESAFVTGSELVIDGGWTAQ